MAKRNENYCYTSNISGRRRSASGSRNRWDSSCSRKRAGGVVKVSFTETIQRVGEISDTYFKALQERQKTGVLKLSGPEVSELKSRLLSLIGALDKFSGEAPLKQAELNKESSAALTSALTCQNCNGKLLPEGRAQSLKGREELRRLIRARCEAILGLLPSDSDVGSQIQVLFSLEVHFCISA